MTLTSQRSKSLKTQFLDRMKPELLSYGDYLYIC